MTLAQALQVFTSAMQAMFFGLMCLGLLLSSGFLYLGLITGDNWVAVCGILFASDRLASAFSNRVHKYGDSQS